VFGDVVALSSSNIVRIRRQNRGRGVEKLAISMIYFVSANIGFFGRNAGFLRRFDRL
jgi:hypothetical protein